MGSEMLREFGGTLLRFALIARKPISQFLIGVATAAFIATLLVGHSRNVAAILAVTGIAIGAVAASATLRLIIVRDGWFDDRPRALVTPVNGETYVLSLVVFASGVGLCVGSLSALTARFAGVLLGYSWSFPVSFGTLVQAGFMMIILLTGFQTAGGLIGRRADIFPVSLAVASIIIAGARLRFAKSTRPFSHDPYVTGGLIVLFALLFIALAFAVRAFDRALEFHRPA